MPKRCNGRRFPRDLYIYIYIYIQQSIIVYVCFTLLKVSKNAYNIKLSVSKINVLNCFLKISMSMHY